MADSKGAGKKTKGDGPSVAATPTPPNEGKAKPDGKGSAPDKPVAQGQGQGQPALKSKVPVGIPTIHHAKFDLDGYIAPFTGYNKIKRLVFIGLRCPEQRLKSFQYALKELQKTLSTDMCAEVSGIASEMLGNQITEEFLLNEAWLKKQNRTFTEKFTKLEADLNQRLRDSIRDKIRDAYMALGQHLMERGDFQGALQRFLEAKNYSASEQEQLQTFVAVMKASAMTESMGYVRSHGDRALSMPSINANPALKAQVLATLGIFELHRGNLRSAADCFLAISVDLADTYTDFILAKNVVVFGTLCALSQLPRELIRDRVLHNQQFMKLFELDPDMHTLVRSYYECNFAPCFQILAARENDLQMDMYFSEHIQGIVRDLRHKAIQQYFKPFVSVKIASMAAVFGFDGQTMERELVALIGENKISGRIDSKNKVLYAKNSDQRLATYEKALDAGTAYVRDAKSALLRMNLIKNNLIVQESFRAQDFMMAGPMAREARGDMENFASAMD